MTSNYVLKGDTGREEAIINCCRQRYYRLVAEYGTDHIAETDLNGGSHCPFPCINPHRLEREG
jgi:hypothetical protein